MGCSNSNTKNIPNNKKENSQNSVPQKVQERVDGKSKRKGGNSKTLSDNPITTVNESALNIVNYFKNQEPPIDANEPWTDNLFKPNHNSLYSTNEDGTPTDPCEERVKGYVNQLKYKPEDIKWARAKDIFENGKFVLFEDTISVDDVKQGFLGNCYFMSTLSSIAETPQLILQLFRDQTVKENGCYEIVLRIDGEWQVVLLDDWFPVDVNNKPIFCRPAGAEIWVMLLEKAWAKINGGYTNCWAGLPSDVLSVFTSFPVQYFTHSQYNEKKDELWKIILNSSNNNDIAVATSKPSEDGSKDTKVEQGIVCMHAFSLFSAKEGVVGGKQVRLLQIRNPWGYTEWLGKWSDSSSEWTPEAKKVFGNHENKNDGCFWIEFEDYLNHFYCTEISFFTSPQITKTVTISEDVANSANVIEITLYDNAEISVSAIRPHWRTNRALQKYSCLQINTLLLRKQEDANIEQPETCFSFVAIGGSSDIKAKVKAGTYLVYSHANFDGAVEQDNYDKVYPYRIQIGASDFFDLVNLGIDEDNTISRLGLIDMVKQKRATEFKKGNITVLQSNVVENTTFGYYFIQNDTKIDYNFKLNDACQNFKLLFPTSFNESIKLLPGNSFISFGPRNKTYAATYFWFKLNTETSGDENINTYTYLDSWTENSPIEEDDSGYISGFIFKQLALQVNQFCEKIDPVQEAIAFYRIKYPELMEELESLTPYNDGVKIKIMDKYTLSDGSYYFSECKIDDPLTKHGRTIYVWANGSKFVGYSKHGKFHGEGVIYTNGNKGKCQYDNGNFVKWG